MLDERWEYGSDFYWPTSKEIVTLSRSRDAKEKMDKAACYGSGRSALLAVLKHGRSHRGWQRLFVPTYFCPEALSAIELAGIGVRYYPDYPLMNPAGLPKEKITPRDVVLRVNYFGWRSTECILAPSKLGCDVIEDHTHDPISAWAQKSEATFCFASLRKTCPIPDGAVLWSPLGLELQGSHPVSKKHLLACALKLGGMVLKQAYLGGAKIEKDDFRTLLTEGETRFDEVDITGMSRVSESLMAAISNKDMRNRRLANFQKFKGLGAVPERNWPDTGFTEDCVPFSIVLLLEDRTRRDLVREQLIQSRVYPAVLWNLADESHKESNEFSSRMLSLPCDFRYDDKDLARLSRILKGVLS